MIAPGFIHDIAGPRDLESALTLVRLWKMKAHIAKDRSFDPWNDLEGAIFDGLWSWLHDDRTRIVEAEIKHLTDNPVEHHTISSTLLVTFPRPKEHVLLIIFEALRAASTRAVRSPSIGIANLITGFLPSYRRAIHVRRKIIGNLLAQSRARIRADKSAVPRCAVDWTTLRATEINAKTGYTVSDDHMLEEMSENITAAWLTTSVSVQWTLKRLMSRSNVQDRLRDAIYPRVWRRPLDQSDHG
jgi:hypothetical protein